MPTDVRVHPTPLYEFFAALVIAAILWALQRRTRPPLEILAAYLTLSGLSRFLVEMLRINQPVLLGLTQPQLWAVVSMIAGAVIVVRGRRPRRRSELGTTVSEPAHSEPVLEA